MKKVLLILLIFGLFALVSCNKTPQIDTNNSIEKNSQATENNTTPDSPNESTPTDSQSSDTSEYNNTSEKKDDNTYDDGIDDWGPWHT